MRGARRSLAAGLALAALALRAAAAETPLDTVRLHLDHASAVMAGPGVRNAKLAALHAMARELLDTRAMGHRALGPRLSKESPATRQEFLRLFDAIIVRAWLNRLLLFDEPRFGYTGQNRATDHPVVFTRIRTDADSYAIDYELRESSSGWQVIDIRVEGISLLRSYHAQFRRLLEHQSFDEVLERLQRKVKVLTEDPA